jgi:isocitrate/isopropylmalate dehydrogenase
LHNFFGFVVLVLKPNSQPIKSALNKSNFQVCKDMAESGEYKKTVEFDSMIVDNACMQVG